MTAIEFPFWSAALPLIGTGAYVLISIPQIWKCDVNQNILSTIKKASFGVKLSITLNHFFLRNFFLIIQIVDITWKKLNIFYFPK